MKRIRKHSRIDRSGKSTKWRRLWQVMLHTNRMLVGLVFVFSGFVKAVDPLGTVYKIEDYLIAFEGFFQNLLPLAFPAAIVLILFELVIGLNLFFQAHIKKTASLAFLFMVVVTPLTFYVALANPVTDCGCFGDAILLSNWQTFFKNIVLFVLTLLLWRYSKQFKAVYLRHIEWVLTGLLILGSGLFMRHNLHHLPVIDFRPYQVGVNIPEAMQIPENASGDVYEYAFIYEKDGMKQTFALDELPDTTWTFVDQHTTLIERGYQPPIHDFSIATVAFEDVTDSILSYPGKTYILIAYDVNKTNEEGIRLANAFFRKIQHTPARFIALTASTDKEVSAFKKEHHLTFTFYKTDPITLKTIIRANPGLVLMENGTIKEKWNWRDLVD